MPSTHDKRIKVVLFTLPPQSQKNHPGMPGIIRICGSLCGSVHLQKLLGTNLFYRTGTYSHCGVWTSSTFPWHTGLVSTCLPFFLSYIAQNKYSCLLRAYFANTYSAQNINKSAKYYKAVEIALTVLQCSTVPQPDCKIGCVDWRPQVACPYAWHTYTIKWTLLIIDFYACTFFFLVLRYRR